MIQFLMERLAGTRELVFATTTRGDDDELADFVAKLGVPVHRGADADVAKRHLEVADKFNFDWIVRVTGDCPFVDNASLRHCLAQWSPDRGFDLLTTKGNFPVGIDFEIFSTVTLRREWPKMTEEEREHLTLRFYREGLGFKIARVEPPREWLRSEISYTVDTPADYEMASSLVRRLGRCDFTVAEMLSLGRP